MSSKKVVLIIMDGWGLGAKNKSNAIYNSRTPFINSLFEKNPHAELLTSGEDVGLPDGQMGNSEVGHLNIGAGRVVYQDLVKINKSIRDGDFEKNPVLLETINYVKSTGKNLHLIGLVSDGGVHSHTDHLKAICKVAFENNLSNVFIHAFTDGRDTDPRSGKRYLETLQQQLQSTTGTIASIVGRYYAMDRDKRWDRIKLAYDLLVHGNGDFAINPIDAIQHSYDHNITDEFIKPIVITRDGTTPVTTIAAGDAVICFNFRTDRCREITEVLTQKDHAELGMTRLPLHYATMTNYDDTYQNVHVIFEKDHLAHTLGEIISNTGKSQLRVAETEKYPHVTFFFSGGRELPFENEQRIMIASPKVATYDLQPEMSALEVTASLCKEIKESNPDFVCLNFANCDMVGHTGVYPAVVKAVETVDKCVQRVVETVIANGYSFIITADHGNAEFMINADGSPNTAHTTNPVPVFLIDPDFRQIHNGRLADLAPTILQLLGIKQPAEMTGKSLLDD